MVWQLQEAKNKLDEVVVTSLNSGPQIISRRGRNIAVLISYKEYEELTEPKKDLKRLLNHSGFSELDLTRDKSVIGRASEQFC